MELTPNRDKVREHNVMLTPLVPPPQHNDLSRRPRAAHMIPTHMIPTVLIESQAQREVRKLRSKGWRPICRRYGPSICMVVLVFFLMQKIDDLFSLEKWVDVYPVSIQRDYSTVQAIDDLGTDSVDTWCFVSVSLLQPPTPDEATVL